MAKHILILVLVAIPALYTIAFLLSAIGALMMKPDRKFKFSQKLFVFVSYFKTYGRNHNWNVFFMIFQLCFDINRTARSGKFKRLRSARKEKRKGKNGRNN